MKATYTSMVLCSQYRSRFRRRSRQPPFSLSFLAASFYFYLIVVWAHCTLVGIVYHFGKTMGIVYTPLLDVRTCVWKKLYFYICT